MRTLVRRRIAARVLFALVGLLVAGRESAAFAAQPRAGYITADGTVYADGSNTGMATLRPGWSHDEVHVFQLTYASSAGQVHWYKANALNLYIGLDHRAPGQKMARVWVYYKDFLGQPKSYVLDATVGPLAGAAARR